MKVIFSFLIVCVTSFPCFSQNKNPNNSYIKFSAGRILFGTGDISGFSINIEGSKNIIKTPKTFLGRLLIGVEFSFENGVKNPVIENPTIQEFINKSFAQVSNSIISGKISYYPFRSLFNGFNISAGLSIGYSYATFERSAARVLLYPGEYRRKSELRFDNRLILGYRITTGYEFKINRRVQAGFRLDFANYNNGDINTLAALKVGYNF